MKKALIISVIIFLVSVIAFGVSVAATGLRENKFHLNIGIRDIADGTASTVGEEQTETFSQYINDLNISTVSAETNISTGDVDKITVTYTVGNEGGRITTQVKGDTLYVEEEFSILFRLISLDFSYNSATLDIILPEREYGNVSLTTASGETDINGLICEDFKADIVSGDSEYRIFAKEIKINTVSGGVYLENCTDRKAQELVFASVSGDQNSIVGFNTDEFSIESASGYISAENLSGKGEIDLVSGEVDLSFDHWDNDMRIDLVSGLVDITLPEESGVLVNLDALSGCVEVDLSAEDEEYETSRVITGESTKNIIGGENLRQVDVDLVSGEVYIHN